MDATNLLVVSDRAIIEMGRGQVSGVLLSVKETTLVS